MGEKGNQTTGERNSVIKQTGTGDIKQKVKQLDEIVRAKIREAQNLEDTAAEYRRKAEALTNEAERIRSAVKEIQEELLQLISKSVYFGGEQCATSRVKRHKAISQIIQELGEQGEFTCEDIYQRYRWLLPGVSRVNIMKSLRTALGKRVYYGELISRREGSVTWYSLSSTKRTPKKRAHTDDDYNKKSSSKRHRFPRNALSCSILQAIQDLEQNGSLTTAKAIVITLEAKMRRRMTAREIKSISSALYFLKRSKRIRQLGQKGKSYYVVTQEGKRFLQQKGSK